MHTSCKALTSVLLSVALCGHRFKNKIHLTSSATFVVRQLRAACGSFPSPKCLCSFEYCIYLAWVPSWDMVSKLANGLSIWFPELLTTFELGTQIFPRPRTICHVRKMRHLACLGDDRLSQKVDSWRTIVKPSCKIEKNTVIRMWNSFHWLSTHHQNLLDFAVSVRGAYYGGVLIFWVYSVYSMAHRMQCF